MCIRDSPKGGAACPDIPCPHSAGYTVKGRPVYVHLNGLANTWLKYSMNATNLSRRSSTEVKLPRRITLRDTMPKITSIWFSHELCLGRYWKRIRWPCSELSLIHISEPTR